MINMPYDEIIKTIIDKTNLTREELDAKIKQKLDQLSGLISKDGAAHIVANELGIKLFEQLSGKLKIKNIHAGMRDVETLVKVLRIYDIREFKTSAGNPGKVASLFVADETGATRIVLWNDQADMISKIKEGDILKVTGAMARENNDRMELHVSSRSKIVINPDGETVDVKSSGEFTRKKISELQGGEQNVELKATIVQVFDIRFFEVCPKCGRRALQKEDGFYCNTHGKVEPRYSNALTVVADDGSGNVRIVTFGNTTAQLLKKSNEEILSYKDKIEEFEDIKNQLLGNIVIFSGRANKNEMFGRIDFIANSVKPLNIDEEIKKMKEKSPQQESRAKESSQQESSQKEFSQKEFSEKEESSMPKGNTISDKPVKSKDESDISEEELDDFDIDDDLI